MLSIIKKFNKLLKVRQKTTMVFIYMLMLIGAGLEMLGVGLMLPLLMAVMQPDIIEKDERIKWLCEILNIDSYRTFVIACIVTLILVFVIKDLFLIGEYYVQTRFICNNRFATQQHLLEVYLKRPYEYYLNAESGEILQVLQSEVPATYALLTTLLTFTTEMVITIAILITIFLIDFWMTLFIMIMVGGIMLLIATVVKPLLQRAGMERQKYGALSNKWLLQAINGIKEVKVTQKESFFEENYNKSGRKIIQAEKLNTVLSNVPRLLIEMVSVCSILALVAIMIYRGREIETLIPSLGAFAMAAMKLLPSANRIVNALNTIAYQEPALDKMLENLDLLKKADTQKISGVETLGGESDIAVVPTVQFTLEREIALNHITYCYPRASQEVLNDVRMVIPIGKSVGIVGVSGAGKTTAVDILLGLLSPQKGQVLADGIDVQSNYSKWLACIGYIPQSIFMLDDTIRSNVAFGVPLNQIDESAVWYALQEAQMEEFVKTLPEGLDTGIGERGIRLSGGQRQRIGIARALYSNPELLIFDEATSALDNETEAAIMESIHSLHGKKTMVIIAHRLQTIEGCDMVYRVAEGKIQRER